jgi:hypothetical protein
VATCLDIIRRAKLSAEGERDTAAGLDAELAMLRLQDTINELPLFLKGEWEDVFPAAGLTVAAKDGQRIHAGATVTVTFPTSQTVSGATIAPYDLTRVHVVGASAQAGLWVYSRSNAAWRKANSLTVQDNCPFGLEDDKGLAALLAVALAGDAGSINELPPNVVADAVAQNASFRARFYREVNVRAPDAVLINSEMGWDYGQQPL